VYSEAEKVIIDYPLWLEKQDISLTRSYKGKESKLNK